MLFWHKIGHIWYYVTKKNRKMVPPICVLKQHSSFNSVLRLLVGYTISYMLATFYMASSTVKYRHTEIILLQLSFHKIKRKSKRSFHKSYNYDAFNLLILLHAYIYIMIFVYIKLRMYSAPVHAYAKQLLL